MLTRGKGSYSNCTDYDDAIETMKKVWNLAVDKCVENTQINRDTYPDSINKNSILQVKEMIK